MHGVFMDVLGVGVLITGESGLGKSELGLELISRNHGLVADDAVEFSRIAPEHDRRPLPAVAAKPAGSARPGPAGHQDDLWRNGGAPQDAPEADRPSGAPQAHWKKITNACRCIRKPRKCWACRSAKSSFPSKPAATSRCCSKPRCATPSCNCAASTRSRNSWNASKKQWATSKRVAARPQPPVALAVSSRLCASSSLPAFPAPANPSA